MSWIDVEPARVVPSQIAKTGASISMGKSSRFRPRIRIFVREGPIWWSRGQAVRVQLGSGDQAGRLRITPNGSFVIGGQAVGKGGTSVVPVLILRLFDGIMEITPRPQEPVGYDWHDDWIEIDLPAWAIPPQHRKSASVTPDGTVPSRPTTHSSAPVQPFRTSATKGRAPANLAGGR